MKKFIVNGKEYKAKEFTFNLVCDLEDMGYEMEKMGSKPMTITRAYFALCAGVTEEIAGREIESHLIGGGDFSVISNAMQEQMENSDFFRNLNKTEEAQA